MRKFWVLIVSIISLWPIKAFTQSSQKPATGYTPTTTNIIYVGSLLPISNFSLTHHIGFTGGYFRNVSLRAKKATLQYGVDATVAMGKKEIISGYAYKYPAYLFTSILVGPSYQFSDKFNGSLALGPGYSLQKGKGHFNINGKMMLHYTLSKKIAVGLTGYALQSIKSTALLGVGTQLIYFH